MAHQLKGTQPPTFTVKDIFGKKVSLNAYKEPYILVAFLRYSGCPYCNLAIHRLSMEYDSLKEKGCEVIAFIQSSPDNIVKNIYERHAKKPNFSIVADPDRSIYKKYGVKDSLTGYVNDFKHMPYWVKAVREHGFKQTKIDGSLFLVPAWFLINTKTNQVIKQESGVSFYNHETFISIYDSLIFKD